MQTGTLAYVFESAENDASWFRRLPRHDADKNEIGIRSLQSWAVRLAYVFESAEYDVSWFGKLPSHDPEKTEIRI